MNTDDPELVAMAEISRVIDTLEDAEMQRRIIEWLTSRYGLVGASHGPIKEKSAASITLGQTNTQSIQDIGMFSDLYDAANPQTDMQRTLVGGYWQQIKNEQHSWDSFTVNKLLKDVGFGVGSISHRLTDARNQKPALLQQVSKSGKSRQARKTYRLTQAGIKYVEEMMRGVE